MKREDFQALAALRLKEARTLLQARCWEGAYYLSGYAIECALKACIARSTERHDFPDKDRVNASHSHDLEKLAALAGVKEELERARTTHPELHANWKIVTEWWEQSRYEKPLQVDAEALLRAIVQRRHGLMTWLRQRW